MNTLVSHMFHISINIGLVYNRLTLPTLHIIDSEHFSLSHTHVSYKYKYRPSIQSFNLPTLHIIDSELHIIDSEHFSLTHVSYKYKYRPSIQSFNPTYTTHYR